MSNAAICDTSPLLYLHRIGLLVLLKNLFVEVWIPPAVFDELKEGQQRGYDVPKVEQYNWIKIIKPKNIPSLWIALDFGKGELSTISLAIENPDKILLLDDTLARRTAIAAGLTVWGTLKLLLEMKSNNLIKEVSPLIMKLRDKGMWISENIYERILILANEKL